MDNTIIPASSLATLFQSCSIGTKVFFWGSEQAAELKRCGTCGFTGQFILKKGMRFLTVFFIIPTIPLSGMMYVAECPQCKTRYKRQ